MDQILNLLTLNESARALAIPLHRLRLAHRQGRLKPFAWTSNSPLFRADQLNEMLAASALAVRPRVRTRI